MASSMTESAIESQEEKKKKEVEKRIKGRNNGHFETAGRDKNNPLAGDGGYDKRGFARRQEGVRYVGGRVRGPPPRRRR